jgi:hypothetical protein
MKTLPIITAVLFIALSGMLALLGTALIKLKKENDYKESVISELTDSIRYSKTNEGKVIAEKSAALLSHNDVSQAYPSVLKKLEEMDIRLKNMRAYMQSQFSAHGSGQGTINNHFHVDSTGRQVRFKEFSMNDGYLFFRTTLYDSLLQSTYDYSYTDTITTVIRSKKKWFLGNEKLYASSVLQNPNAKVTGATNLLIDSYKDKRWYVGVGASYNPLTNTFGPSVNAGYILFKF